MVKDWVSGERGGLNGVVYSKVVRESRRERQVKGGFFGRGRGLFI